MYLFGSAETTSTPFMQRCPVSLEHDDGACATVEVSLSASLNYRYNVMENGFSHAFGFFWGVVFPWVVALPLLYQPNALNQFIGFSSLIFVSFTDFM